MHEFETEHDRSDRLYRRLDSLIKRVEHGENAGPLREQLAVDLMMSPLKGVDVQEAFGRFDHAVAVRHEAARP